MTMLFILALPLLVATPQTTGSPLGTIPRQDLPAHGCAAYLWAASATGSGARTLVAMAQADPARLRVSVGGATVDLERSAGAGASGFGFAETGEYGGDNIAARLTMRIETRETISGGAVVPDGVLTIDRTGQDSVVVPVAGLIGCAG